MAPSLLSSTRQVTERVRTYSPGVVAELTQEADTLTQSLREDMQRTLSAPAGHRRSYGFEPSNESLQERARAQRAMREAEAKERDEQLRASMQRRQAEHARRRDAEFQSMYTDVLAGLSNDAGIMGETQYALDHSAKVRAKKKAALHDEWQTQVFDKIQDRLQASVSQRTPHDIERRLKSQYDQYLHTTNTKVGVFRDVIIEQDYNPMTANDATIRVPTGDIRDPLKRDVLKAEYERRMMGAPAGPRPPVGKVTLDTRAWGDLAIHATPYGHCVNKNGEYVVRPASGSANALRESHIPLDHYNFPRTNEAAAAEVPKGKAIVQGPEQRRGRADLFDVVQHTCHLKPQGFTGGDSWLEHRGKALAPGPEQRRGRKDLSEVLAPTSNPYQDGRTLGDAWLEAKGKARVAGPEVKHARNGLFETIQQSTNPYKDGRSLGDAWLEAKGKRPIAAPDINGMGSLLTARVPPLEPRQPADPRKFGSHLVAAEGQLTVR